MSAAILLGGKEPKLDSLINSKTPEQLQKLPPYTMEVGLTDQLFPPNVDFHNLLLEKNVTHTWITRPGVH